MAATLALVTLDIAEMASRAQMTTNVLVTRVIPTQLVPIHLAATLALVMRDMPTLHLLVGNWSEVEA